MNESIVRGGSYIEYHPGEPVITLCANTAPGERAADCAFCGPRSGIDDRAPIKQRALGRAGKRPPRLPRAWVLETKTQFVHGHRQSGGGDSFLFFFFSLSFFVVAVSVGKRGNSENKAIFRLAQRTTPY